MIDLKQYDVWFVTGSQHLYGEEALRQVAADATEIAQALTSSRDPCSKCGLQAHRHDT